MKAYWENHQWWGSCSDAKALIEKLIIPLEDLVQDVSGVYLNGSYVTFDLNQLKLKFSPSDHYGRCYHLDIFQPDFDTVRVLLKQAAYVTVHSPGLFSKPDEKQLQGKASLRDRVYVEIEMEVYHALDSDEEPCYSHGHGSYDKCILDELDKYVLKKVGCTYPYGNNLENICKNETQAGMIDYELFEFWHQDHVCTHPCTNLLVTGKFDVKSQAQYYYESLVSFHFYKRVKVVRNQYSYTMLSMVAEIGGYVGLFLGVGLLQAFDFIKMLVSRYF